MHLVNLTTAPLKRTTALVAAVLFSAISFAQENSPYSQYGMGDIAPSKNVINRAMGGISTGIADFQSINLNNPAAIANLATTVFDVGGSVDIRMLKSNTSPEKFKSVNTNISYLQLGFPLGSWKAKKSDLNRNVFWGLSFGLRPITRVNYKIESNVREPNIDSSNTIFEGNGGLNQANISTGLKIKNLSLGFSTGYSFGTKDYSRRKTLINDTVAYQKSNSAINSRFTGVFLNLGAQYDIKLNAHASDSLKNPKTLRIGAVVNLQQKLSAKRDEFNETFYYDVNGGMQTIDTITRTNDITGKINYPATYSFGLTYSDNHWTVGADFDFAKWGDYSYYGQKDVNVKDNFTFRAGAQYFPATQKTVPSKYWSFVKYRAGVFYGNDYIHINQDRPEYGVTLGAGFPLTSLKVRNPYGGFATLNAGVEIGGRGNRDSQSIRENTARFSIGISMNARWFQKLRYD